MFGSNGVIKKAQESKEQTEIGEMREKLEMAKVPVYADGNGSYKVQDYWDRIESEGLIADKTVDIIDNGDGTYEVTTTPGYVFEITVEPNKEIAENIIIGECIGKGENLSIGIRVVKRTTNSIEIELVRAEGASNFKYSIKKQGEEYGAAEEKSETRHVFSGLTQGGIYTIKVEATKDGEQQIVEKTVQVGEIPLAIDGDVIWTGNGQASVRIYTEEEGYQIEWQKNGIEEGNWTRETSGVKEKTITGLVNGDIIYARLYDGTSSGKYANIEVRDDIAPTATIKLSGTAVEIGKPLTAEVAQTDNESGININQTKWILNKEAGNIGTGTLINQTTEEVGGATGGLVEGNIIASNPTWSNGTASITLSTSSGLTIQYQKGGISGSWTTGTNVTGLHHRDTVFARLTDGKNYGGEASITILDTVIPQDAGISLSGTSTTTEGSITATVTLKDNESGVNAISSRWIYNTTSGAIGENESSYTGGSFSSGQRITLKATTAGTYYLHVLTVDNAGNKKETISSAVTVEAALVADGNYNASKGVNTPKLGSGMTPIKWNGSSWVNTTGSDPEWYDYTAKKWANAKTSDGSMWVWIPRYAYSITSGYHQSGAEINPTNPEEGAGTIEIKFLKDSSNIAYDGTSTWDNVSGQGKWNVHPAFNYGQEVSGIWVAKFEASPEGATTNTSNSEYNGTGKKLQVKPGVSSWRSITISNIYDVCKNYNSALNSHMMKNDEWGAVAYLSKSKYGKQNEEVWINNSSSYITGSAGNSASAGSDTGTTNDYTSTQGVKASTTGTVYGVYDMSGGAWEYVAGYVNNGHGNLTTYGSSLVNGDAKTKNVYSKASSDSYENNYNANSSKYGDAVYETSTSGSGSTSWYGDYSDFPSTGGPFFQRGGHYNAGTDAGVFFFYNYHGGTSSYLSFRPVLVAL